MVTVDPRTPDRASLERAGAVIRRGGLVAFPTETVYGLGANALDPAAIARIFAAKGRPANDPVIVHVDRPAQVWQVARHVSPLAARLIARFWPGPLTLVLPRAATVPSAVSAGLPTVAVRMPAHPVALGLIAAAGRPVAAPSANRFSRPSATTAAHVIADLDGAVDLILDAGPAPIGLESTILDLSGDGPPVLLRPGGLPLDDLIAVAGPIVTRPSPPGTDEQPQVAPGLMTKHYAPRAEMLVIVGERVRARARLRAEIAGRCAAGQGVGVLLVDEDADLLANLPVQVARLGSETRLAEIGERLFSALRDLDTAGVDVIAARDIGAAGLGLAIRDRLVRAAAGRVIDIDNDPTST
ncbi:MAG: threonylcarbamoyl-AMP synthase [Chloroflexi bacterium]|nr:threonylcarbamoyl-AMP synthase [Chloroflexota bacterium]